MDGALPIPRASDVTQRALDWFAGALSYRSKKIPANNGNTNAFFIAEVRRILRDQAVWYGESQPTDGASGSLAAGSKPFRTQRAPILTTGAVLTAPGGPYTIDFDVAGGTPITSHVNIVSDTGEIIFATAPSVGTLAITYQSARYSDTQILDALTDGLNLLWPEIWNPSVNTTQILVSPTQYEYPLQAIFQDPRVILRTVEFAPPSGIVRYFRTSLWRQVEDQVAPILVFKRIPPVASQVRLGYIQPFTALSQPPTQVMNLPVYYAISRLLMDQETMRGRSDDLPALTGESANPTGSAINTSSYWLNEFKEQLTKLSLSEPSRMQIMDRAVERLGLSEMWASRA